MKTSRPLLALLTALILLLAPALAPAQAPATGGPAFWTITRGGARVFILGAPAVTPKGMAWDTRGLDARLAGASALIMPATPKLDALKIAAWVLSNRASFQSSGPMEASLPPPLRARFVAARTRLGQDAGHYAQWKPGIAGLILANDFRKAGHLATQETEATVKSRASHAGVAIRRPPPFDVMPLFKTFTTLPPAAHQACLSDSLADVEAGSARIQTASLAWARGDMRTAVTAERGYERCLAAIPGAAALADRSNADTAAAIAAALTRPGKAVALVQLRSLVDHGGVLDRLRAQGYVIEGPAY